MVAGSMFWLPLLVLGAGTLALAESRGSATKPHIIFMLVDDLGYNAPGYRNSDLITPTLDELSKDGIILEEYYVYKYCAPTRGAFHTGRFPYHLDAVQKNLIPWSMPAGIDLRYDFLPKILKKQGYATHHIGKWHQGFFTEAYTPLGRGYDTTYGFLVGGEDHFSQNSTRGGPPGCATIDLSRNGVPCFGQNGTQNGTSGDDARYNGFRFTTEAVSLIENHTVSTPMFMYFAIHNTHNPTEAPLRIQAQYSRFTFKLQKVFNAMVTTVDETAKNVTDALKTKGMWDNTLFIWSTDNGSPIAVAGTNDPLKGGKGSNWEGGCRVPAFVAGGLVPHSQRGQNYSVGIAHIIDWYQTFANLAGADAMSDSGTAPAPLESVDLWPWLSGKVDKSPRTMVVYDHRVNGTDSTWNTQELPGYAMGALRVGQWKIIVGGENQASWYGHFSPNGTRLTLSYKDCVTSPCLYDVLNDKTEHVNVAAENPDVMQQMLKTWAELSSEYHPPPNPKHDDEGFCSNVANNGGFITPWQTQN